MLQFLKVLLDIVLWRRGPQDLPASSLLLALSVAAYVVVSILQLALLDAGPMVWFVALVVDPLLLGGGIWLLLRLFSRPERFLQTATAVLGTGTLFGVALLLLSPFGLGAESRLAGIVALAIVVAFALVTGRILKLATDSNLFTGVALSLTYFLLIDLLLELAAGKGS